MVHGIKSPDALLPRAKLFIIEDFEISPSKQTFLKVYTKSIFRNLGSIKRENQIRQVGSAK